MIEVDPTRFTYPPFEHQLKGIRFLLKTPDAALFDEMGIGKTYQVINTACLLWESKEIDIVLIVAPASVRGVWDDPETGEISKFCWVPHWCGRYDRSFPKGANPAPSRDSSGYLAFLTVSYAYLRKQESLDKLSKMIQHKKVFLVLDESSAVKGPKTQQTRAALKLRKFASRCVILNGTPVANNIMDLWSQFNILNSNYIRNMNYYQFRSRFTLTKTMKIKGKQFQKIVGVNEDQVKKLKKSLAPYVLRREKKDCLDLPDKLYTYREVEMPNSTWKMYKDMRDQMVAFLDENPSIAMHGAVKAMRLSQLTSGILGGFEFGSPEEKEEFNPVRIDSAKIDAVYDFILENPEPTIIWCRFRKEIFDLEEKFHPKIKCGKIVGGQSDGQRQNCINGFQRGDFDILIGQPHAGGMGLNLTRASRVIYLSNDYSLISRSQSEDRCHRPGQKHNVTYIDFLAVTPEGRKTIDYAVVSALKDKKDLMSWTVDDWRKFAEAI